MSEPSRAWRRQRTVQIVLIVLSVLLACCCLTSSVTNVGLIGWAVSIRQQVAQSQQRAAVLEAEVERLRELLIENEIPIPIAPADEQLMDTIEQQVAAMRGLQPLHPLERTLMTQQQLRQRLLETFQADTSPEEMFNYALTLAALDLIDPHLDLYNLFIDLYTEQIAGFYDPETEQIYVIGGLGLMGQMERLTYAHEFNHALQDQHYDLEALGIRANADEEFDSEYLTAIRALVEGDSSLLEQQFMNTYTPQEMFQLLQEYGEIDMSVLNAVPPVVRDMMYFPYEHGLTFVGSLYEEGGWSAVDAAYANPPRSTEQILHPDRYHSGDMPQIVSLTPLTDTLGAGWRQTDEDILGEYFIRYYLQQRIPQEDAQAAAEGWGGDRYVVHYREADEALLLAAYIVWDTAGDAEEFVDAYVAYAEARFGHVADVSEDARLCWAGRDFLCLTWGTNRTTFVLGPERTTVEAVLATLATTP